VVVAARDEAQRIAATIAALRRALPGAAIVVADDGSRDRTAEIARALGARVVSAGRHVGKGRAMSLASASALESAREPNGACASVFLLCDGDLAESAGELAALVRAVGREQADLAIGAPTRRVGGGFGIAVGFARRALRAGCGLRLDAPMSGQRALSAAALEALLPFAEGYGMELAMTIDAVRAGLRVRELELDFSHRSGGRTPAEFAHRGVQLAHMLRAYRARIGAGSEGATRDARARGVTLRAL
jgi:glycosyltransferase involved in cell wall biosynthesis